MSRKRTPDRATTAKAGDEGARLIALLRERLGENGRWKARSRAAIAELVGASPRSVFNWERGLRAPARRYLLRLQAAIQRGRPGPETVAREDVRLAYANVIEIVRGPREVRVRFCVTVPGLDGAQPVADLLVPADVFDGLAKPGRSPVTEPSSSGRR